MFSQVLQYPGSQAARSIMCYRRVACCLLQCCWHCNLPGYTVNLRAAWVQTLQDTHCGIVKRAVICTEAWHGRWTCSVSHGCSSPSYFGLAWHSYSVLHQQLHVLACVWTAPPCRISLYLFTRSLSVCDRVPFTQQGPCYDSRMHQTPLHQLLQCMSFSFPTAAQKCVAALM